MTRRLSPSGPHTLALVCGLSEELLPKGIRCCVLVTAGHSQFPGRTSTREGGSLLGDTAAAAAVWPHPPEALEASKVEEQMEHVLGTKADISGDVWKH